MIEKRHANRRVPIVQRELNVWWDAALNGSLKACLHDELGAGEPLAVGGGKKPVLDRSRYIEIFTKLGLALLEEDERGERDEAANVAEAYQQAAEAWTEDSRGRSTLSRSRWQDSLFELADTWTHSIDAVEYAEFLRALFMRTAQKEEQMLGAPELYRWRENAEVEAMPAVMYEESDVEDGDHDNDAKCDGSDEGDDSAGTAAEARASSDGVVMDDPDTDDADPHADDDDSHAGDGDSYAGASQDSDGSPRTDHDHLDTADVSASPGNGSVQGCGGSSAMTTEETLDSPPAGPASVKVGSAEGEASVHQGTGVDGRAQRRRQLRDAQQAARREGSRQRRATVMIQARFVAKLQRRRHAARRAAAVAIQACARGRVARGPRRGMARAGGLHADGNGAGAGRNGGYGDGGSHENGAGAIRDDRGGLGGIGDGRGDGEEGMRCSGANITGYDFLPGYHMFSSLPPSVNFAGDRYIRKEHTWTRSNNLRLANQMRPSSACHSLPLQLPPHAAVRCGRSACRPAHTINPQKHRYHGVAPCTSPPPLYTLHTVLQTRNDTRQCFPAPPTSTGMTSTGSHQRPRSATAAHRDATSAHGGARPVLEEHSLLARVLSAPTVNAAFATSHACTTSAAGASCAALAATTAPVTAAAPPYLSNSEWPSSAAPSTWHSKSRFALRDMSSSPNSALPPKVPHPLSHSASMPARHHERRASGASRLAKVHAGGWWQMEIGIREQAATSSRRAQHTRLPATK